MFGQQGRNRFWPPMYVRMLNPLGASAEDTTNSSTSNIMPHTEMVYSPALWADPQYMTGSTAATESRMPFQVDTLQQVCRSAIIKAVTFCKLDNVEKLPLPPRMINFLKTFRVPEDFDTDGFHWTYNFHFPYHPHHRTHRVHPAVCRMDGTKVLIKAQNEEAKDCALCTMLGAPLLHQQESDHWACVKHPNLQTCYMKMIDNSLGIMCYVLEYPVISLKDLTMRLSFSQTIIPEYLIWDSIHKLASVIQFLHSKDVHVELYEPQHFILDEHGNVKVENLLLYLPKPGRATYRTGSFSQHNAIYTAPEQWQGRIDEEKTVIWALGCLFYEMATLSPAFLLETYAIPHIPSISASPSSHSSPSLTGGPTSVSRGFGVQVRGPPNTPVHLGLGTQFTDSSAPLLPEPYSLDLQQLIACCLKEYTDERPTFQEIIDVAFQKQHDLEPSYDGPRSLLELLPSESLEPVSNEE